MPDPNHVIEHRIKCAKLLFVLRTVSHLDSRNVASRNKRARTNVQFTRKLAFVRAVLGKIQCLKSILLTGLH